MKLFWSRSKWHSRQLSQVCHVHRHQRSSLGDAFGEHTQSQVWMYLWGMGIRPCQLLTYRTWTLIYVLMPLHISNTYYDKSEQQTPEVLKSCWQTESVDCVKFTMWIIYEIIYVQVIISCPKLCTQPNLKREIIAGLKMIHSEQRPLWTWSSHNHRHTFLSKTLSLLMWEHRLL